MPTTYKFQVSWPVTDTLPRNRMSNTLHFQHVTGGLNDDALESMCADLVALYAVKYKGNYEILCKAYDTDAVPNNPRASVVQHSGLAHQCNTARELALVLSYAGEHRGVKSERGRIYTNPFIVGTNLVQDPALRPTTLQMEWALGFFSLANESFPDIGGVDWKFGIYSPTYKTFTQAQQAWVNDDWDVMRSRGLRETQRITSTREG